MKKKYQNGFFLFGAVLLGLMLWQLDYKEVWAGLQRAGYWFFAVVALWAGLYLFNTFSWHIILRAQTDRKVSFWWLYKITVSGFALNYATPGGLMGGEPYRIMSLSPRVGAESASASVILFVMTHIFSHFWFWLLSVALFLLTQTITLPLALMLAAVTAFCLLGIWFFMKGYKKGLAVRVMNVLRHIPFVKRWATRYVENNRQQLDDIDRKIAALHSQNPRTFALALGSELTCRILSALEIYFILLVLYPSANYLHCILILAFTTLFANLLFFLPLQMGGREGGFFMSVQGMGLTASDGIFVALIVRFRELIWTAIGLLLIKLEKTHEPLPRQEQQDNAETPEQQKDKT